MNNIGKLLKWELHPSRTFFGFNDLAAKSPRFIFHPETSPIPEGATGCFVGEQNQFGFQMFMAGVRLDDQNVKDFGQAVMLAAVRRQKREGIFPCEEDIHHSVSFFLEVVARLLLLRDKTGAGHLLEFCKCLRYGAQWFGAPATWQDGWWIGRMHHRFFLNSSVLYLADAALRSVPDSPETRWLCGPLPRWCIETADSWVHEGIGLQREDGAITEGGGHDTGYHSLAMTYMAGTLMAGNIGDDLRSSLTRCLDKAACWLLSRIRADGSIDASGNTRMASNYGGAPGRFGTGATIGVKFYETAFALYGAGLQLEDDKCLEAAERIMRAVPVPAVSG